MKRALSHRELFPQETKFLAPGGGAPLPVLGGDFAAAARFFDDINLDKSHFATSNDEPTPMGCVKEMVDTVPPSFWRKKNLKVLDPCAGNGNFHAYLMRKTKLENLIFNEINPRRVKNICEIFGAGAQVSEEDFLHFAETEDYDLVVCNPPYAKFCGDKRASKNHNLSRDFILKALAVAKPGGYILFIVPDNWMSLSDRNGVAEALSRHQFRHLNIHGAKKWFPKIGSSFSWFLLQKSPNREAFPVENFYKIQSRDTVHLAPGARFIPLYFSRTATAIFDKTVNADGEKYKIETSSDLHRTTKKHLLSPARDDEFCHKTIHTPTQTLWSRRAHKYQQGWKVFISLTNQYGVFVDQDAGATQSIAFIRCASEREAKRIEKELNSDIYRFLNNATRYGNFNNVRVLQKFPLFSAVKLTRTERDFVHEFNRRCRRII